MSVTDETDQAVYGALFKIANSELAALDKFEGPGYDRIDSFDVALHHDGSPARVITYIAKNRALNSQLKPYDWYKALIIAGATDISPASKT